LSGSEHCPILAHRVRTPGSGGRRRGAPNGYRAVVLTQIHGLAVRSWGDPQPDQPVVLALHGLTSTSAVWTDLATRLPGVPVLAPDLPGRGLSVAAQAAPGLPGLAAEVVRVVDELGLGRVVVLGHSMGAFLVPLVVDQLDDRAVGTVLLDGGVPPEPSLLLNPLVVRTLFTLQLRRVVRTWPDVDRYTAAAEGGGAIAAGSRVIPRLTWERVDANHATMLFDPAAAAAVGELIGPPAG
jgi:pimeloyl-ACP methyl ester carboxylesterase